MNAEEPFTIEQFYKFVAQGKLMAGKCLKCGRVHLPPRPLCDRCFSEEFKWISVSNKGKLLTYTVVHIAPPQFNSIAPYAVGIIQLENDLRVPGIISDLSREQLNIGMDLTIEFGSCDSTQSWPQWPRYRFKPE